MHHKRIATEPKTFALIMDIGDEIVGVLKEFATSQKLSGSSFKAIGALSHVKLGWFNWETKQYEVAAEFVEQMELLSVIGDIAMECGKPAVHAHVVVGRRDATAYGGHLLEGHVRPTCELILTENSEPLQKHMDQQSGIALIKV